MISTPFLQQTAKVSKPSSLLQPAESNSSTSTSSELKNAFTEFVGGTFFQMMLKSMRTMHDKPAYMHGGQAEEIFQGQLDQQLAEDLTHNSGEAFSDSLYRLFQLQLKNPPEQPKFRTTPNPAINQQSSEFEGSNNV